MPRGRKPKNVIDELMGFRIYRIDKTMDMADDIGVFITSKMIRLTKSAMTALKYPSYILVFFDEMGKRMMFQTTESETANAIQLRSKTLKKQQIARCIQRLLVIREIERISGIKCMKGGVWLPGHSVETETPSLIFCFEDMKARTA